jgi:hypothetical protein
MNVDCEKCEGSFIGKGFCEECGNIDICYYGFCKLSNEQIKDVIDFAKDMQGNTKL